MTAYASGTQVPASRSRDEIERTLKRFGAKNIAFASLSQVIVVAFTFEELTIRVQVPLPVASDDVFVFASVNKTAKRRRTPKQAEEAWQREVNRLWRALAAVIKAKLVAVDEGVSTVESEFLSAIVLPDGRTMGEWAEPQLARGEPLPLLPSPQKALGRGDA